jgi:5-deoxy-glucuronate isomerase
VGAFALAGRASVWEGASDYLYLPPSTGVTVGSLRGGRFAVPAARATSGAAVRHMPASATAPELRGTGSCSREIRNFAMSATLDAERLLACEVLTPGGNWSSYPPHKHDEVRPGEAELEEVYYYEVARSPEGEAGLAYQQVYGTAARPIELLTPVASGDIVLIPHGWHGPAMAAPGYDLYYLNVMAGPGERVWRACDDPAHAWVRETWAGQPIDPRLPFGRTGR